MAVRGCAEGEEEPVLRTPPTMGNFMGVVTCGTRGCARGPPSSAPTICSEAKSRWGKGGAQGEEGAAAGSTGPTSALTSPPTPTFLKQMSPIDELKVRSSLPPPTRAAHCGGWEEERAGGVGREPSPAHS